MYLIIGDIDVIAALGDSLTAASGASSVRVTDLVIENRGLSWSIGGQWSFKNSSTLPNILKGKNSNVCQQEDNGNKTKFCLINFSLLLFLFLNSTCHRIIEY